jgi:hypothetical protein
MDSTMSPTEIEARLAILDLEARYARTWDTADAEGWASVFTADGAFVLSGSGTQDTRRYEGTEALRDFCREANSWIRGLHFLHPPELAFDGDTARGRVHFQFQGVARRDPEATNVRVVAGYYDVTYVRTAVGWRMHERIEHGIFTDSSSVFAF